MKRFCTLLPVAVFLCSCTAQVVTHKPGGELVDGKGRPYNVRKNGKWELIRPLPEWYVKAMSMRIGGRSAAPEKAG